MIGDGGLAVPDNPGRPRQSWLRTVEAATNELWTGDVEAACSGQINMAETHDNGYVCDKLLKKKNRYYITFCRDCMITFLLLNVSPGRLVCPN